MTDLELLLCVFAVIYGCECAWWLRRTSVAFRSWFGRRWRAVHPCSLLGNQAGGFVFAPPLPPLGLLFAGNHFPLSLSPEALLVFVPMSVHPNGRPPQTGKLFLWDNLKSVEARGKKVCINGERLLQTRSPSYAVWLAQQLDQLRRVPRNKRESSIRELVRGSFDTRAVEGKWQDFRARAANLRRLTNSLFGYLFILIPACLWHLGLGKCWLPLLLGMLALTTSIALLFRKAFKRLYPSAEDELFTHFLTVLLSPATAIRAHDLLARPLLEMFHPLAVAKVLLPENHFREFAGWILREARHPALPLCPSDEPTALDAERYWRTLYCQAISTMLKDHGIDPEALEAAPERTDQTCQSYCPRCLAQFTTPSGTCADCGGLSLVGFNKQKAPIGRLGGKE